MPAEIASFPLDTDLEKGLNQRPQEVSDHHFEIVRRVAEYYRAAMEYPVNLSPAYEPGGEWKEYHRERISLHSHLMSQNLEAASGILLNFWRGDLSPIVKEYAKYEELLSNKPGKRERFIQSVTRNYRVWREIFQEDPAALTISHVGNPWGLFLEGRLVAPKATRYHSHASQVIQLTRGLEHRIVCEIGAGYGGMANYLLNMADNLTYLDFDLPNTQILAAYYLLSNHSDKPIFLYGDGPVPGPEEWSRYRAILLPHYELRRLQKDSIDVMVNTFSLSEMPKITLEEYLHRIKESVRGYFLHNNMDRAGVLNRGHERIPASQYPVDNEAFQLIYKHFDLFHGHEGDYREFLYKKLN